MSDDDLEEAFEDAQIFAHGSWLPTLKDPHCGGERIGFPSPTFRQGPSSEFLRILVDDAAAHLEAVAFLQQKTDQMRLNFELNALWECIGGIEMPIRPCRSIAWRYRYFSYAF